MMLDTYMLNIYLVSIYKQNKPITIQKDTEAYGRVQARIQVFCVSGLNLITVQANSTKNI